VITMRRSAILAMLVAGCGGGPSGPVAHTEGGGVITSAGGAAVTAEAHNHWQEAIQLFRTHDREAQGWSQANCEATMARFRQANEAQGGRFTEAVFMMGVVSARCGNESQAQQFYPRRPWWLLGGW